VLLLIILTSAFWSLQRVGLWWTPEWGDEAHYVLSGWRIATGERIYVDFYDGAQKPPLLHWTAAAVVRLLGNQAVVFPVLRALTILCRTATIVLVFLIGRMLASNRAGWAAAALFSFHAVAVRTGNRFMTEAYSTLFALLALWVFLKSQTPTSEARAAPHDVRGPKHRWRALGCFLTGALIALGMQYRPTPVLLGMVIGLAILGGKERWKAKLQALAMLAAGLAAGLAPLVLYLASNRAFYNFYLMVIRHASAYPSVPQSLRDRLTHVQQGFFHPGFYRWLILLAVGTAAVQELKRRSRPGLMLVGWLGLQLVVMLFTIRQVSWHYFYEVVPVWALVFALGFEHLLGISEQAYARLDTKGWLSWLLEEGRLLLLLTAVLLPVAFLVLCYHLQWALVSWRAGSVGAREVSAAIWPGLALAASALLVVFWESRHKYPVMLLAMVFWGGLLLISPRGSAPWKLASGIGVTLCFTVASGGWVWKLGKSLQERTVGRGARLGRALAPTLAGVRSPLSVLLWLFFLWLVVGQVELLLGPAGEGVIRVRYALMKTDLKDAEAAADYIHKQIADDEGMISLTGEINFLLGKRLPIYWGADHEEVADRLGIARMVGRELADVPAYCREHKVRFIVFYRRGVPDRMGSTGADYVERHYGLSRLIGPYRIHERMTPYDLP